jgi:hypothetical protein
MKYFIISISILLVACNETKMPPYDGTNAFEYYKTNCSNKSSEILESAECKKANDDDSRQRLRGSPMKAK